MNDAPSLVEKLINAILNNELKLPTQPEVAVRIRECAADPNLTSSSLSKIILQDPGLTAKFIQIANSPLMRGRIPINSLPDVISRLGLPFVCSTATGLAMEQIFQATNEEIDKMMRNVWTSSSYVAAYSHVLAKHYSRIPAETASLAGLMHQIGILPILMYAEDHDELIDKQHILMEVIKDFHSKIGEVILKTWQFPEEIILLQSKLYIPQPERQIANLTDVLQVALSKTKEEKKAFLDYVPPVEDAYKRLNVNHDALLSDESFKVDLEESMRFYCKFQ